MKTSGRTRQVPLKKHPSIACCGIDCGLCPRYHTTGSSRCPGCAGKDFREKHPSCSILTCCVLSRGLETCAECDEFICGRIDQWDRADSFVTHRVSIRNLRSIRTSGIDPFLKRQKSAVELLVKLIEKYDDGRSKSFYCLSAALLPTGKMEAAVRDLERSHAQANDRKVMAKLLREAFSRIAKEEAVDLSYRKHGN